MKVKDLIKKLKQLKVGEIDTSLLDESYILTEINLISCENVKYD